VKEFASALAADDASAEAHASWPSRFSSGLELGRGGASRSARDQSTRLFHGASRLLGHSRDRGRVNEAIEQDHLATDLDPCRSS